MDFIHLDNDYRLLEIDVDTLAKVELSADVEDSTGEVTLEATLNPSGGKSFHRKTKIILSPDGHVVYPQSLYLVSRLRGEGKLKDTSTAAKALLLYTRWLASTHEITEDEDGDIIAPKFLDYDSLTEYEEEGAPFQFAQFLVDNCRHRNADGDESWALSTAKSYMRVVLSFYDYLHDEGFLPKSRKRVVHEFTEKERVVAPDKKHDMLAHTKSPEKRKYTVSNIMALFPRTESTPAHKKLRPMTIEHQTLFDKHVSMLPKPYPLMFSLSKATGLRIEEVAKLPADKIGSVDAEGLEVISLRITETKGSKPRKIEIPTEIYDELEIYKYSKQREKNVGKRDAKRVEALEDSSVLPEKLANDYLFLNNRGMPYNTNSLEKKFQELRDAIRKFDDTWYYKVHCLRSTFATNWLDSESKSRNVGYDYLLDELATLMGHESTSTTEKYIQFMNERDSQLYVAKKKNNKIQRSKYG